MKERGKRPHVWLIGGSLALVGATGCGAPGHEAAEPAIVTVPVATGTLLDQPLMAYILTPGQFDLISEAKNMLQAQCVRRFGLEWQPPAADRTPDPDRPDTNRHRPDVYVFLDETRAREFGYQPTPEERQQKLAREQRAKAAERSRPKVSPEVRTALTGEGTSSLNGQPVPLKGCISEADRKLHEGTDPGWDANYPSTLAINLQPKIEHDRRVMARVDQWGACMKQAGFTYRTPQDAEGDPRWKATETASPEEKAVAVAEARCGRETDLAALENAVEIGYQKQEIEAKSAELASFQQGKETVLRSVSAILGR
ncbi:hypothetical protein ACFWY9_15835 [Amycolatopsis sp. NPDC059027]|uniref:hypothetical protein n=1 Tax=Amycolatopsis sp. NPDC059027 TaxID=3346709 RepID=UPI00366F5FB2